MPVPCRSLAKRRHAPPALRQTGTVALQPSFQDRTLLEWTMMKIDRGIRRRQHQPWDTPDGDESDDSWAPPPRRCHTRALKIDATTGQVGDNAMGAGEGSSSRCGGWKLRRRAGGRGTRIV